MKTVQQIQKELMRGLSIKRRHTGPPVIVATIGITGAGASTVARELGRMLGWSVVEKNKIRVKLREEGPGFTPSSTDRVHDAMLHRVLDAGGNVILDSDFIESEKRRKLERFSRTLGARVVYLHLACDRDVMIQRMLRVNYNPRTDVFKSAAIAVREHCRRYPWHYRWSPAQGGRYVPRRPTAKMLATLDTTDPAKWKKRLRIIAGRLRRM